MGTLQSELAPEAERLTARPRIYSDANVPVGLVAHMRHRLRWDVLHVLEDNDLRRALELVRDRSAGASPTELYSAYRQVFASWVSSDEFDVIVQQAVLEKYRPPDRMAKLSPLFKAHNSVALTAWALAAMTRTRGLIWVRLLNEMLLAA